MEETIPQRYETDGKPIKERKIYAHYLCALKNFDWFVYEYDPETREFFGFVNLDNPDFAELGYFSLSEFEELNKMYGFSIIERDASFIPAPTEEVAKEYLVLNKILDY